ncbi:UNVERIFIED_CONTAM: hypothetical protein GTU68_041964 [Idotea baltica]|nr:hypothetical protein [Idotea baltica]
MNEKGEEVELCSSIECKGIIGNDGRHYILDLLRTFPPDVNFLPGDGIELSPACKEMGFPQTHKHKLATLRQELVDAFVDNRYMLFLKYAAVHLQKLTAEKKESDKAEVKEQDNKDLEAEEEEESKKMESLAAEKQVEEAKKMVENVTESIAAEKQVEENTKAVIKKAAEAVGSLKEADFDIRFNPDVFSPGVKHAPKTRAGLKRERKLVVDAADFLVSVQLPNLMRDFADHSSAPTDGATLTEAMHNRGINVRYLGKVVNLLSKAPELRYIYTIAVAEAILRAVKHIFIDYVQSVETIYLSSGVAHFLNCFLSACNNPHPPCKNDELVAKKKKKRQSSVKSNTNAEWTSLSPRSLWNQIKGELKSYFDLVLKADLVEGVVEKYGVQKVSLLRSFCLKCGVQVMLRNYTFDSRHSETFRDEDLLNLFPIVKHINPRATDAFNLYTAGQTKIQQGFLKDGFDLISEALNLLNNVYGAMHPEIAQCLRMLARINYIMGDYMEAMSYQQKATLMSERVNGIDSPYTITEYIHLALYCFANQQVSIALKLLYRARYLLLLIHGEIHPEVALVDSNIGLILHAVSQYSLSLQFLEKALDLNIMFYGEKSLKVALSYHLVARTQSCMGDFRSALRNEKETFTIYREQLGSEHDKTKEADECLRHLTQQAVVMAKKINEAVSGRIGLGLPPIQIQPPSMSNVLELLNIINGILYIQITQAEIDRVRQELEKGHLNHGEEEESPKLKELEPAQVEKEEELEKEQPLTNGVEDSKHEDDDDTASR